MGALGGMHLQSTCVHVWCVTTFAGFHDPKYLFCTVCNHYSIKFRNLDGCSIFKQEKSIEYFQKILCFIKVLSGVAQFIRAGRRIIIANWLIPLWMSNTVWWSKKILILEFFDICLWLVTNVWSTLLITHIQYTPTMTSQRQDHLLRTHRIYWNLDIYNIDMDIELTSWGAVKLWASTDGAIGLYKIWDMHIVHSVHDYPLNYSKLLYITPHSMHIGIEYP